jgi:hypothetical protein
MSLEQLQEVEHPVDGAGFGNRSGDMIFEEQGEKYPSVDADFTGCLKI